MKLNLLIMLPIFIYSQNVDMYLSLIHEGQSEGVKEILPELISKYPNDPGVLYLQAMLTTNGMKSLELYSKIIDKFPKSDFGYFSIILLYSSKDFIPLLVRIA